MNRMLTAIVGGSVCLAAGFCGGCQKAPTAEQVRASASVKPQPQVSAPKTPDMRGFVTKEGAKLYLNGREYRAIGVNIPNLHQSYMGTWFHNLQKYETHEKARQAMVDAVVEAEKTGVAFVRFFAGPGYPRDVDLLYAKDPETYWKMMDEVFALCRTHHIRLIPSLGTVTGWHNYCGEKTQAILDPTSKTYAATHTYIREFVTRYKDDPLVLMWELENEVMLKSDVDMKDRPMPPKGVYSPGAVVREKGERDDSLRWDMILKIYNDHAAFIKTLDSNHLVTSGDAATRPERTSRRESFPDFKYRTDTWDEFLANNIASQPDPLDVYSFHQYGSFTETDKKGPGAEKPCIERYRQLVRAAQAVPKPVFIGELGQGKPSFKDDPDTGWTLAYIDALEEDGTSLIALWVWHFTWQPDLTFSRATHPKLSQRIAEFNQKYLP